MPPTPDPVVDPFASMRAKQEWLKGCIQHLCSGMAVVDLPEWKLFPDSNGGTRWYLHVRLSQDEAPNGSPYGLLVEVGTVVF